MEQVQEQQHQSNQEFTFRDYVDMGIVFGCIPALILNIVFWAIATTFSNAGILPNILALLITLLLSLIGIILVLRYVDVCVINGRKYNAMPAVQDSENALMASIGAGFVCLFLAAGIIACLSTAGTLEGWHYTLMGTEILLVGYQTWRVFISRQH